MSEYNTEQKRMLWSFLCSNCEISYTAEELVDGLRELYGADAPGKSTVYRLLPRLVEEGQVKRLVKGRGRSFVYQGVRGEDCRCHLHMKCMSCGKLFHLDESVSDELLSRIRKNTDFSVNEEETVLFGKCGSCS